MIVWEPKTLIFAKNVQPQKNKLNRMKVGYRCKQYSLNHNIEIQNVPPGTRENEPNSGRPLTVSLSLPFDHAERDLNAKLKPQLQSICASLKLNSEVTATNVTILNSLLDDILVQMKRKDPLFHLLFKRLEFSGSYYDGLRIKKADEFDIDLVLNLPFEKDEFTASDGCPGHVGYEVSPAAVDRLHREGDAKWVPLLLDLMDGERRLVPERVTQWLESVLGSVLRTYVVSSGPCWAIEKIRLRQHGPAVTLYIKLKDGNQIDVDLVPVIEFRHPSWPTGVQKKGWMANMLPEDCNWFLIPKPPMSMPKSHLWRLHFPNMEKRLIEDKGCVKPIIRLLKAMRDSYGWNLSSYSLKTFVMSQVLENDDAQYWHPDNQGMLFVRVLDCLGHALAQPGPAISFIFHPEVDLTETVTRKTRDNISGQIKGIVRKLWLFPDQCYELVLKNEPKGRPSSDIVVGDVVWNNILHVASNHVSQHCSTQLLMSASDVETDLGPDKLNEILVVVKESEESNKQYIKETMDKLKETNAGIRNINSRVAKLESIIEVAKLKEDPLGVNAAIREVNTQVNIISRRIRQCQSLKRNSNCMILRH
ncbi:uncharacterized protein LOC120836107 [Ixodes scapularis]|uniref:uncharacterized protein LOC120836107 n=1 Tax=Ixodes scapularis TaxID=6945 RepID=UPI001C37EA24|nr:uncharacterized protein LOC120836107 [Ixodes scapularis]